jgi:hypothetical protein
VAPESLGRAEVVLILAGRVTEVALCLMRRATARVPEREIPLVLVCDEIREAQLLRALGWGMVSVLLREDAGYDRIVRALADARDGGVEVPREAPGWLESRIRAIRRDVLDPQGLTAARLFAREVDVLRLPADGLDTQEIAGRLSYSERTRHRGESAGGAAGAEARLGEAPHDVRVAGDRQHLAADPQNRQSSPGPRPAATRSAPRTTLTTAQPAQPTPARRPGRGSGLIPRMPPRKWSPRSPCWL